ncbi:MAG: hypothetical protein IH876_14430 [Gemmatimonadetes bacterium]|nr:hypothetical protein [Gemmatimonadota bacterium]
MKYSAWAILMLGLVIAAPSGAQAQPGSEGRPAQLERNYPNPFNPETTIPFVLSTELWDVEKPVVSLRIYNVLAQLVAIPILQGSGDVLENVELDWNGTGRFVAYWDGKVLGTGREAASGVYVYQLIVNGRAVGSMKMTIIK